MIQAALVGLLVAGGGCGDRVIIQKQAVVHAAPVAVVQHQVLAGYPAYYYQVGTDIRFNALADAVAEKVLARMQQAPEKEITGTEAAASAPLKSAQAVANDRCINCHKAGSERMNLQDLSLLTDAEKLEVTRQVYSGNMPPNGAKLSDEETSQLVHWLMMTK